MTILLIIGGLIALSLGGDVLVRGAVGLAQRLGVSALVTGLVLVGFGTSTPELAASLNAVWNGVPGIALGNVVGSNIANILLILGLAALIYPMASDRAAFRRDGAAADLRLSRRGPVAPGGADFFGPLCRLSGFSWAAQRCHSLTCP